MKDRVVVPDKQNGSLNVLPELDVFVTDDQADVIVGASELSDANRAQIEDIVTRKTGVAAQNIVINPVNADSK